MKSATFRVHGFADFHTCWIDRGAKSACVLPFTALPARLWLVLAAPDAAARRRLNALLALLARNTNGAAIYVIGADGRTIAARNAGTPLSFVGRDFTCRACFAAAMAIGRGEQFALGSTPIQPGLYLAAWVDRNGRRAHMCAPESARPPTTGR